MKQIVLSLLIFLSANSAFADAQCPSSHPGFLSSGEEQGLSLSLSADYETACTGAKVDSLSAADFRLSFETYVCESAGSSKVFVKNPIPDSDCLCVYRAALAAWHCVAKGTIEFACCGQ